MASSKIPDYPAGSDGRPVPAVGFGTSTYPPVGEDVIGAAVLAALYGSERAVGEAVAEAARRGVVASREEVFVTTKVWCTQCHPELVIPSLRECLPNLQMEYVDLYLVHFPIATKPRKPYFPIKRDEIVPMDLSGVWRAMEECNRLGLA